MNVSKKVMSIVLTASMLLSMSMPCFAAKGENNYGWSDMDFHMAEPIHYADKELGDNSVIYKPLPKQPSNYLDVAAAEEYNKNYDKYMKDQEKNREAYAKPFAAKLKKLGLDPVYSLQFTEDIHLKLGEKKKIHIAQEGIMTFLPETVKKENIVGPTIVAGSDYVKFSAVYELSSLIESEQSYCLPVTIEGIKPGTALIIAHMPSGGYAATRIIVDDDKASSKEEKESSDKKISVKKDSESSKKISIKKDEASTNKTTSEDKKVVLTLKNK